jgi:hypothetical protein
MMCLLSLFCFNACKSQNKDEAIKFDSNTAKIYYPIIGELRGKIKEVTETMNSSLIRPLGNIEMSERYKYVFDNDKKVIYCYNKENLSQTMFFDKKWLIDSSFYSNGHHCYFHKTLFHETYLNYTIDNSVKSEFGNKIDTIKRVVNISIENKYTNIESFDVNNRLIKNESLDFIGEAYTLNKYNDEGDLITVYVKVPNRELQTSEINEYEYDQNRNWIKKISTNRPNDYDAFKTLFERKISYLPN